MFFRDVPCFVKSKTFQPLLLSLKLKIKLSVELIVFGWQACLPFRFHSHWAGTISSLWFCSALRRGCSDAQRRVPSGQALHLLVTNCHQEVLCASNRLCIQRTSSPFPVERPRSKMLRDTGQRIQTPDATVSFNFLHDLSHHHLSDP